MMRPHGVRARLLLMVTVVVAAAMAALVLSSRRVTRAEFRQFVSRLEAEVEAPEVSGLNRELDRLGAALQESLDRDGDWRSATALLDAARQTLDGRDALLVVDGRDVVAATDESLLRASVSATEQRLAIRNWNRGSGDDLDDQEVNFIGPRRVIRGSGAGRAGILYVLPPLEGELRDPRIGEVVDEIDFLGSIDRWLLALVAVVGLLAFGAAILVSSRIVGPIEKLTEASRRMGGGDLSHRVRVDGSDELAQLAGAFNAMAASLEHNEKLRRDMVSDVAHELRTPLTNLRAQLESVQDGLVTPSPELVASLHEEALLLGRLVDDLQELALADAGQLGLDVEDVDLRAEIERLAEGLRGRRDASESGGELSLSVAVDLDPQLPPVRADRQRLRQVLTNLVDNAVRHGGGEISIGARRGEPPRNALSQPPASTAGFVLIAVTDDGPGIEARRVDDVFERFYRTDPSRQRSTGGAGLGLAIVRQLVEAQGGCVWAHSRPGSGSTFGFCLPATR